MRFATLVRLAPVTCALMACLLLGYVILDGKVRAQEIDPDSVMELIESLKMTDKQQAGFQAQEALRIESQAKLKQLQGEELKAAREAFQADRTTALQDLFTEEQWGKWDAYWTAFWTGEPTPPIEPGSSPSDNPIVSDYPENKGEASGRFQVARRNGRTTLITPEGEAFFSLGVTHIQAIGAPAADEPKLFADRFKRDWSTVASEVNKNLRAWGYNSTGYGTPRPLGELIPYAEGIHTADTSMYFGNQQFSFPDVFDPAWQEKVKQTLRFKINAHKDNPNLMGFYWADMPLWDLNWGKRSG
ncbi:MAG: hypothetical protein AAF357_02520, partial [Verrucomicrobiota bacterium]